MVILALLCWGLPTAGASDKVLLSFSSERVRFSLVASVEGYYLHEGNTLRVHLDRVVVTRKPTPPYQGRVVLNHVLMHLSGATRTAWEVLETSNRVKINDVYEINDRKIYTNLDFEIPLQQSSQQLKQRWLTLQLDVLNIDSQECPLKSGYTYASSAKDIF